MCWAENDIQRMLLLFSALFVSVQLEEEWWMLRVTALLEEREVKSTFLILSLS